MAKKTQVQAEDVSTDPVVEDGGVETSPSDYPGFPYEASVVNFTTMPLSFPEADLFVLGHGGEGKAKFTSPDQRTRVMTDIEHLSKLHGWAEGLFVLTTPAE